MAASDAAADALPDLARARRRPLARSRRARAEKRVQRFLDAALELMHSALGQGVHRPGGGRALGPVAAQLLPVLRRQARAAARPVRGVGAARPPSSSRDVVADETDPPSALHRFAVEYYRLCRPAPQGQAAKRAARAGHGRVRPAAADLPPRRRRRGPSCRWSSLLEELLDDAAAAGVIRPGLRHRRIAGVVLQAIMFNAFATTISGTSARPTAATPPRSCGTSPPRHRHRPLIRRRRVRREHARRRAAARRDHRGAGVRRPGARRRRGAAG